MEEAEKRKILLKIRRLERQGFMSDRCDINSEIEALRRIHFELETERHELIIKQQRNTLIRTTLTGLAVFLNIMEKKDPDFINKLSSEIAKSIEPKESIKKDSL